MISVAVCVLSIYKLEQWCVTFMSRGHRPRDNLHVFLAMVLPAQAPLDFTATQRYYGQTVLVDA